MRMLWEAIKEPPGVEICGQAGPATWEQARIEPLSVEQAKGKLLAVTEETSMFHRRMRSAKGITITAITAAAAAGTIAVLATPFLRRRVFRGVGWLWYKFF